MKRSYVFMGLASGLGAAILSAITWNQTNLSADITINALLVMVVMFLITDSIIEEIKKGRLSS